MAGSRATVATLMLIALAAPAAAELTIPDSGRYVVDRAGVIDPATEARMEAWLRELEERTTAQVKVLAVPSTQGEDIFTFAQRHAEAWKLGRRGEDNGALIVLSVGDREVRIQVGYGLEAVLPDSYGGSVSRQAARDHFKRGAYGDGLLQMVLEVANKISVEANTPLTGVPARAHRPTPSVRVGGSSGCLACGLPLLWLTIVILATRRRSRYARRWGGGGMWEALFWGSVLNNMMRGGRRSTWSGLGGGLGGGFGGSFGGGGRFGGGGGGARW